MPKLFRSNIHVLEEEVVIRSLPHVFQDSIFLCRQLNIRYLWVDALCIIQDDEKDCEQEIANMEKIYSNATLNIGASRAADLPGSGLFTEAYMEVPRPFKLCIESEDSSWNCFALDKTFRTPWLDDARLMLRGWVLQERILSRRSVYFGEQLTWECAEKLATEVFPGGVPYHGRPFWGVDHPLRLATMLDFSPHLKVYPYTQEADENEAYVRWLEIGLRLSGCSFTYDKYALPAISGLAKAFGRLLNDEYLAGLWRRHLIPGLFWYVQTTEDERNDTRPSYYRDK
jgi:hypothetical protein